MLTQAQTTENIGLEEAIDKYGSIIWNCRGQSMKPLIRETVDLVIIEKPDREIIPYDVVLYAREVSVPGDAIPMREYVLHRVMEKRGDELIILGDNCITYEHVMPDMIIGLMTGLIRDGKKYDFSSAAHRAYMDLWVRPHVMRVALNKVRSKLRKVWTNV